MGSSTSGAGLSAGIGVVSVVTVVISSGRSVSWESGAIDRSSRSNGDGSSTSFNSEVSACNGRRQAGGFEVSSEVQEVDTRVGGRGLRSGKLCRLLVGEEDVTVRTGTFRWGRAGVGDDDRGAINAFEDKRMVAVFNELVAVGEPVKVVARGVFATRVVAIDKQNSEGRVGPVTLEEGSSLVFLTLLGGLERDSGLALDSS